MDLLFIFFIRDKISSAMLEASDQGRETVTSDVTCRRGLSSPAVVLAAGDTEVLHFRRGAAMNASLSDPAFWGRFQFGFTLIYHYLFPQLTMGLAWFFLYWKWRALRTGDEKYNRAFQFWAKIFGLNFAVGVVTGIPMEFQFGTNWASLSRYAGGVIGQTLAMEGMFAFFLESAFVGVLIWGEKRSGQRYHFVAVLAVALSSWLSAYFILVTNAFMQHPAGYQVDPRGSLVIGNFSTYLLNPWALIQFSHNQIAALVTGSFVATAMGAFYTLRLLPRALFNSLESDSTWHFH
jgi:cytochrome bd ubiquinol oxidase subunit I